MASLLLWEEQRAAKPCADSGSASARNGAGHPSCLPSMARPGKLKSRVCGPCDRPGHCVQKGPVLVLILRCHLLDILNSYWPRGATYSFRKLCSLSWLRASSQTWKRPGKCTWGHQDPPEGSGHLGQRSCQSSHYEKPLVSITRAPAVTAPRTRSLPSRVLPVLWEAHEVYSRSALTPDLLCAGSHLPSSGIPAPGHLCERHTLFASRLPALELTSDTLELLSSWPLPWFAGSWAAFFFLKNKILMLSFLPWQPGSPQMRSHTSMTLKKYENRTLGAGCSSSPGKILKYSWCLKLTLRNPESSEWRRVGRMWSWQ